MHILSCIVYILVLAYNNLHIITKSPLYTVARYINFIMLSGTIYMHNMAILYSRCSCVFQDMLLLLASVLSVLVQRVCSSSIHDSFDLKDVCALTFT